MRQIVFPLVFFLIGIVSSAAFAGNMEPSAAPDSTNSYTLEDIYNRLNNGTAGSQSTFSGPSVGPTTATGHTLDQVMEKAPKKDDTDGAKTGDVKADKKFWGLNAASGEWGLQTGTGCDPASRWCDNGDGTVTDTTTGLVWLKNAKCTETLTAINNSTGELDWDNAMIWSSAVKSDVCELTDGSVEGEWRLPTKSELAGITTGDDPVSSSAMQEAFTEVQSYYWTSTSLSVNPIDAWYVNLGDGFAGFGGKTVTFYVWPVRGGQ